MVPNSTTKDYLMRLGTKQTAATATAMNGKRVPPRRRGGLARRRQAFQDDLELLILGPAPSPAGLHRFKPLDVSTALITV